MDFASSSISCAIVETFGFYSFTGKKPDLDRFFLAYRDYCVKTRNFSGFYPLVLFSGRVNQHYQTPTQILAKSLNGKWGKVVESDTVKNPTHNSDIKVYLWYPSEEFKQYTHDLVFKRDGVVKGGAGTNSTALVSGYLNSYRLDRSRAHDAAIEADSGAPPNDEFIQMYDDALAAAEGEHYYGA